MKDKEGNALNVRDSRKADVSDSLPQFSLNWFRNGSVKKDQGVWKQAGISPTWLSKETTMLRNTLLAAVAIIMMPAVAMAVPTALAKSAPAAMTTTAKSEKIAIAKHHAKVKKLKATSALQHKAKVTTVKS